MVNTVTLYKSLLQTLMKLAGVEPRKVEIEPGTVMNFWVPTKPKTEEIIQKPSVVFVHGFGADGILTWMFQVFNLTSHYSVYVPDLLFFGGSTTSARNRSLRFQTECLATGLRKLGVERCVVVGLSYGGMIGFKMAELYPDLVESMVVSGSVEALTESLSSTRLKGLGQKRWSDFLLPTTAEGVKELFRVATHWLPPWIPNRIFKDYFEVMFSHRKEREELLEAMIIKDEDFTPHHYHQTIGRESETAIHREGRPPSSIREALCIQRAPQADSSLFNNR
ncbi:putative aminoacrylate hydrolase RutD isoform X2 [Vitis riparia]|uniref:putative aminoacrylate hydrolase RutD isoform X2 n=1 Tax=Vitis riparia TaxID=96939 RepID=UPI00155A3E96|nr:putative aminoacrylate hydrolase RutD isoform X2 [Vitis riparia]